MSEASPFLLAIILLGAGVLCAFGLKGVFEFREALRSGELERMSSIRYWKATRAFCGFLLAIPAYLATRSLGVGGLAAWVMPSHHCFAMQLACAPSRRCSTNSHCTWISSRW